jgi:ubiquinone/menaquinone biosynthesis C-methylase UbiE
MTFEDNTFDIVFSHHVLGLCPDYLQAYRELIRVTKPGGYIITLNDIPGNKKKHYSLIKSVDELTILLDKCPDHKKLFYDYKNYPEFIVILQKC